jgi:hypothetical protein
VTTTATSPQPWWRSPRRLAVVGLVAGLVLLVPGVFLPIGWVASALLLAASLATLAVLAVLDRRPGHDLLVDTVAAVVVAAVLGPMLVWPWTQLDTTRTTDADWEVSITGMPHGPVVVTGTHAFWLDESGGLISIDLDDGAVTDTYAGDRLREEDRPGLPGGSADTASLHARMIADDAAVFTTGRTHGKGRIALVTNGGRSLLTRPITAYDITPLAFAKGILVVEACGYRTVPHRLCTVLGLDDRLDTAWSVAEPEQPGQPWSASTGPLPTVAVARTSAGLVRLSSDRGQPILTLTEGDSPPIALDDPQLPPSLDDVTATSVGATVEGVLVQQVTPHGCRLLWFATNAQTSANASARSKTCGNVVANGTTTFTLWDGKDFWSYEAGSDQVDVLHEDTWANAVTRLHGVEPDVDSTELAQALEPDERSPAWRFDPPGDEIEPVAATSDDRIVRYHVESWNPLRLRDAGWYVGRLDAETGRLTAVLKGDLSTTDLTADDGFVAVGADGGLLVLDGSDGEARYYGPA